jgi:hypothetical protein
MFVQKIQRNENEEDDSNDTVHGEKRSIEFAQVIFRNQGMLVGDQ